MIGLKTCILCVFVVGCGGEQFSSFSDTATQLDGDTAQAPDAGTGGGVSDDGGGVSSGGSIVSGSGGNVSSGGTIVSDSGPAGSGGSTGGTGGVVDASGGTPSSGGSTGSGGAQAGSGGAQAGSGGVVACTPVTHDNGLGQTWQDCVPLGTYDVDQAMKACKASFGDRCAPDADPQYSCQGVGGIGAALGGQEYQWVYVSQPGAGVHAGDMLESTSGTFKCPNWPGASGAWN